MPTINITRGATATAMVRSAVPNGAVFAEKRRDGRVGRNYAALGMNGRMYSINLTTGELASSSKEQKQVVLTGKWSFDMKLSPKATRTCRRSEVNAGELFRVKGGEKTYAHIGAVTRDHRGWLSVPIGNLDNHAYTENGGSTCEVVGFYTIEAELAA